VRILSLSQVFPKYPDDSTAPFLKHWADGLSENGIKTTFLVPHHSGLSEEEQWGNLTVKRFRYGSDDAENLCYSGEMHTIAFSSIRGFFRLCVFVDSAYKATKKELLSGNYDQLVIHWAIPSGVIALLLLITQKQPYSIISHGTDIRLLSKLGPLKYPLKLIWKHASHIYTVSHFLENLLELPAKVIPMPLSNKYIDLKRTQLNNNEFRILYVGRMSKQKRIHLISEALLQSSLPAHWRIRVVGDGVTKDEFVSSCARFQSQLELFPPVSPDELPEHYNCSDIIILPSENEGFGLVLVEAMAHGCYLAGADSGAIPEIISNDSIGSLFTNSEELRTILENIDKKRPERSLSTEYFLKNYSPGVVTKKWADSIKETK